MILPVHQQCTLLTVYPSVSHALLPLGSGVLVGCCTAAFPPAAMDLHHHSAASIGIDSDRLRDGTIVGYVRC